MRYVIKYQCPRCGEVHAVKLRWLPCEDPIEASGDALFIEADTVRLFTDDDPDADDNGYVSE